MNQRKLQCLSWIGRNHRSRQEHLEDTLKWRKSGGGQILGGEVMDSPRNHQETRRELPNHLESLYAVGEMCWKGERSPNESQELVKGVIYPWCRT
jgi:hypothetical protein